MKRDLKVGASLGTELPVGVMVYLMMPNFFLSFLCIFSSLVFFTITRNN